MGAAQQESGCHRSGAKKYRRSATSSGQLANSKASVGTGGRLAETRELLKRGIVIVSRKYATKFKNYQLAKARG
jgi:hypothetical protein